MKRIIIFSFVCILLQTVAAQSPLEVRTLKLDNGLTVWLNEDHNQASVYGAIVVKAGAKDSPATGIAHYFEHIMFKGTDKIGTVDYVSERIYLDSIAIKYDLLAQTKDETQRKEIQAEINRLSIEAAKYAIPNEFNTLISKMGGSGLNAGTGYDQTVYYNVFDPQYINQWLELNSERLRNPVFRLFQSELETVYEEKNMYNDMSFNVALEKILERTFKPHPYQYPIVGLTEYLKNPSLSEMEKFYKEYYRAGNMGLILSGDFDTEKIIPVIEEKFGRLAAGKAPARQVYNIPPFEGRSTEQFLVPIPIIKVSFMIWRGVPNGAKDEVALDAMMGLLSNSSGTGYLDLLGTDGKLLTAGVENMKLNDAGVILAMIVPKLVFQSYEAAEKLVLNEINRIKKGDFSEEDLECIKLELKREFETSLETSKEKAMMMVEVFSLGKDWNDYLKEQESIEKLTKNDIIDVANRYFTNDYLYYTKKNGRYDLDKVKKPDFDPIVPPNKSESSEYAKKLIAEANANTLVRPRTVDFEKDVHTVQITPLVTLYTKENPVNEIFTLQLNYQKGNFSNNMISPMSTYLNDLYTDSLSYKQIKSGLQRLGATVNFESNKDVFTVEITGFDKNIEPTLQLVSHFMKNVKPDKKALQRVVAAEKMSDKSKKSEAHDIAQALNSYVIHGKYSTDLTDPSAKEIAKKGEKGLLDVYHDVITTECDVHYSGNIAADKIKNIVVHYFDVNKITQKAEKPIVLPLQKYDKPIIFVLDNPKAKQSAIYSYTFSPATFDNDYLSALRLFNEYFGGGMSSIMFQEIREFRSLAYGARSFYSAPMIVNKDKGSYLQCYLSTQSDKTIDAISVLDSLLKDMPRRPENLLNAKQSLRNSMNNEYPSFRNISPRIASLKRGGYKEDTYTILLNALDKMDMNTITDFYNRNVKANVTCYVIAGNMKSVDMEKLKQFGEVKVVKTKEIFK